MSVAQRQYKDNLVYWPLTRSNTNRLRRITQTMSVEEISGKQALPDDSAVWQHHINALSENQDRGAFHELYLHYAPKVKMFYIKKGLSNIAEELTHEVFMKIWRKAASYNPKKAKVSTWIFTIVRNTGIDYLRKKQLDEAPESNKVESYVESDIEQKIDAKRQRKKINSTFELLNDQQRNVLQKVYFEDKSHQVTAEELEMTLGVVKSRVRSALKILRDNMGGGKR